MGVGITLKRPCKLQRHFQCRQAKHQQLAMLLAFDAVGNRDFDKHRAKRGLKHDIRLNIGHRDFGLRGAVGQLSRGTDRNPSPTAAIGQRRGTDNRYLRDNQTPAFQQQALGCQVKRSFGTTGASSVPCVREVPAPDGTLFSLKVATAFGAMAVAGRSVGHLIDRTNIVCCIKSEELVMQGNEMAGNGGLFDDASIGDAQEIVTCTAILTRSSRTQTPTVRSIPILESRHQ